MKQRPSQEGLCVLEAAAIDLVARMVERAVDAAPDPLGQVAVVAGREPPPEAELADLVPLEVLLEAQHAGRASEVGLAIRPR
jgi:hypothetical protein